MTWRAFVSTLLLVAMLAMLPLAFQDGQAPRRRMSEDGSNSGHQKDYKAEVTMDDTVAQSQAHDWIQLSEVSYNDTLGGGGSNASTSTTVPAVGLLPRFRSLIDPESQPPFWWRFVTLPLMISAQFLVLGFDVRFKPVDLDWWKKPVDLDWWKNTAMSIVKPIMTLGMACAAANCVRRDALEFLQSLTPEDSGVQAIFKFMVVWVTSPNLEKAVSYFVAVSMQAPSRVFVPDKFRDKFVLMGVFITADPEELPIQAKYTKMPVMRYLSLPATPFSARWMTPTKWLYMVALLPYAFPVWSAFCVSWWWPMAVSCCMCLVTFWPTRLLATCATCCCLNFHAYVFFSSCVGVVITLGLWDKEKKRVASEWAYAWPGLYIFELLVANCLSVIFGLLLFADPWVTLRAIWTGVTCCLGSICCCLASPALLMGAAILRLCGVTQNQDATADREAENDAQAEAETEIQEAKADGMTLNREATADPAADEAKPAAETEIEEATTEEAQARPQMQEQAGSATEVEAEQEDVQAIEEEKKLSAFDRARLAILAFQSETDMDADFENWNFAEPNDQEMGPTMRQGYVQGAEQDADLSKVLADQEPGDIQNFKTWICMATIIASCMLVWFQLFLIIFIRTFTNDNTAEGVAKAWGHTLSERTMAGYVNYIRRSMTDAAVLASTKVNLAWNFL